MKARKVSADVFSDNSVDSELLSIIKRAEKNPDSAYKVTLDDGETEQSFRYTFRKVKKASGIESVNLFKVNDELYVANRPQKRGRPPKQ